MNTKITEMGDTTPFHQLVLTAIDGSELPLSRFAGAAVLVVNTASQCGLTPQYQGLEQLHRELGPQGLVVLGLPCNQFGAQEPGTDAEIQSFCSSRYQISFPLSSKIDVNGPGQHPLYAWLTGDKAPFPGPIRWNFEKFLIDPRGHCIARFSPQTAPDEPHLRQALMQAVARADGSV